MAVLITGGTKGVGLAIARRFAVEGAPVFLAYRQDAASAQAAVAEIEQMGGRAWAIQADVGAPQGARRLIEEVRTHTDHLDLVVHGAVKVLVGPLLDLDPHQLAEAILLNGDVARLPHASRSAAAQARQQHRVSVQPGQSPETCRPTGPSAPARRWAESLARYLVPELAPRGIRINCVAPGTLDTEAVRNLFGADTDAFLASEAAGNPSGRNVTHDDYVGLVAFLASPAAAMIQGQVIFVNGGQYVIA